MEPDDLVTAHMSDLKRRKRSPTETATDDPTTLDDIELDAEYSEMGKDMMGAATDLYGTRKRIKRQAPYIIYPEILVIVDYDGYRLHGGDNLQVFYSIPPLSLSPSSTFPLTQTHTNTYKPTPTPTNTHKFLCLKII